MKAFTAMVINNSVAMISFVLLALFFEKWWIMFFALPFMVKVTTTKENEKGEENDK